MQLQYEELRKKPERLLAWTGLTQEEIERTLPSFEAAWEEHRKTHHRAPESRKRAFGAGRPGQLRRVEDKLLFILVYFKVYPLQEVQGTLFGMSQSQANEWIHRLSSVLQDALQRDLQLPARDPATLERVLSECESHSFVVDGTERPTQRPGHTDVQKERYSGKKKTHTYKNVVVGDLGEGKVRFLSPTAPGSVHDKTLAERTEMRFPSDSELHQDSAFQTFAPKGVIIYQPRKKQPGKERSDEDRQHNRIVSQIRVSVEHLLAGVKRVRIVKERFRNTKPRFADRVMLIACSLHNLRQTVRHPLVASATG